MKFDEILKYFKEIVHASDWDCKQQIHVEYQELCNLLGEPSISFTQLNIYIENIIVKKMGYYKEYIQKFIDICAKYGILYNYQEKININNFIIQNNTDCLVEIIRDKGVTNPLLIISDFGFKKITFSSIIEQFIRDTQLDIKKNEIYESIFSAILFNLFPKELLLKKDLNVYLPEFYDYLKHLYPDKYNRNYALSCLNINYELYSKSMDYSSFINSIFSFVKEEYNKLQNYCYFAIIIDSDISQNIMWSLYSDIVLFSEKHIEEKLRTGYFHPEKIKSDCLKYIKYNNWDKCKFDIANDGFTYKDCYIISEQESIKDKETYCPYKILILFQKNQRDEDIIPCPACRSKNVRGNSYPTLGVKSWECNNNICPDKSKYNRGKRYSMSSIIKQEAIENPFNLIEKELIAKWHLDFVSMRTNEQILELLIKEYSISGDSIYIYNFNIKSHKIFNREIISKNIQLKKECQRSSFFESSFFKRFILEKPHLENNKINNLIKSDDIYIYNGDCYNVLQQISDNSIDGAITSPPYYNAKEYSYWSNIYCYLYDMYNHAREVFRVLKPGSYYLYNIFDYFDNENNIVFSAMGKKRMILGAYIIHLFNKIGFEIQQNIIWYKGEIQGHRSTNQGNFSPYYQAPLNCYEHIFCFRKPGKKTAINFPTVLKAMPVIKIINGKNTYGHSAPYPLDIPNLLCSRMEKGNIVLDPYAGSFTTARSAWFYNIKSINIESSFDYCQLGIKLINDKLF